ncbi:MAG: M23 family metallopeptidase [Bacteroidota bacterium]|nr:M23 family metallopeptidase [Bacteroidota bacterium]
MRISLANLPTRHKLLVFSVITVLTAAMVLALAFAPRGDAPVSRKTRVAEGPTVPQLVTGSAARRLVELRGEVRPNMPFITAMLSAGIERTVADTIQKHLGSVAFDFGQCRPGQRFTAQVDSTGALRAFRYDTDRLHSYWILPNDAGLLEARTWKTPVRRALLSIEGRVRTSVYHTIMGMGETPQLVSDYADVLGYDIDFIFDPRVGDRFRILVERHTLDGDIVGYGPILAAEYEGEITGRVIGYRFDLSGKDSVGYFAPDGENLQKAFMRSPLSILRVTSGFGMRTHPISGRRKMHTGIDYGAPTGTPVWSIGAGTVIFAGWKGGYGKTIEIRHSGSVVTRYGHLSKIHVRRGQAVRQHQTIGAVGSTGYSTGPHLHFEYLVNGVFTPPRKVKNPALKRLPKERMPEFTAHMARVDSLWNATPRFGGRPQRNAIAAARSRVERKTGASGIQKNS